MSSQTGPCHGCRKNPCTHKTSECTRQNIICPSCKEWPCTQFFEDCSNDLDEICEGCGNCPCTHNFEDCDTSKNISSK